MKFDLELFFQLSGDLLCIAGRDGYFKKVNPMVSKTLGFTEKELFSKPINDFVYKDDKNITTHSRNNLRKDIPLLNFENRYLTKSGDIIWLTWTSIPVENEPFIFAIAKNITHKKRLEEDRNKVLTDLTLANQEMKQLTYATAHDLRAPVNNLIAAFGLIELVTIKDTEVIEYLEILQRTTQKLKETLNNYLDVLIQKNSSHVNLEKLSLTMCLQETVKSLKSLIADSNTDIQYDFSAADQVFFNSSYLNSIFLNLITNSIKYAKPNTYPSIHARSYRRDGLTTMVFSDEGIGFDLEKVEGKIFGFSQKFSNHDDSKGIGLYLINSYLNTLGGKINVESQPNCGSRFTICFKD